MKGYLFVILTTLTFCDNLRLLEDQSQNPDFINFFQIQMAQCNTSTCPLPNTCLTNKICKCQPGFANYSTDPNSTIICSYKMKKQLTAFLLQFLVCNGAGHFYVGNIKYAVPQLLLSLLLCCFPCISACLGMGFNLKSKSENAEPRSGMALVLLALYCITACVLLAWWLADAIIFGMNKYTDSNGIPLESW